MKPQNRSSPPTWEYTLSSPPKNRSYLPSGFSAFISRTRSYLPEIATMVMASRAMISRNSQLIGDQTPAWAKLTTGFCRMMVPSPIMLLM